MMDITSLRKALLDPKIYPDLPGEVRFTETHISLLFFTGKHVYKVKKPVNFGFLDFTSLEKRRYFCEQEVTLNRRLAPRIYLGVVSIVDDGGWISLGGKGEVREYAVKMRQIPEESLMDKLLEKGRVTPKMIEGVSEKLTQFYSLAETNEFISRFGRPERVRQDTDENFEQTERYINVTISQTVYEEIRKRTNQFFKNREKLFHRRMDSGHIRDCHGDLRLEHMVWDDEVSIYDCIEFNQRFRYTDVAADLAFLAMDLDYRGRGDLNEPLIRTYVEKSGDQRLIEALDFYKCYRAYVRGKVESFRLDDLDIPEEEKTEALKRAQKYFALSFQYAQKF